MPEHFYAEVLAVFRRQFLGQRLSESQATVAVNRLGSWHLRHASVAPLVPAAWSYRHNLTVADALYVALAEQLGASLLLVGPRADASNVPGGAGRAHRTQFRARGTRTRPAQEGKSKSRAAAIANTPDASEKGGRNSGSGRSSSSQSRKSSGPGSGGNRAQKAAAGRKGGKKSS